MAQNLEQLAISVGKKLKEKKWKLVTAESCTGGSVAYWITSIPGSSDWFERGFVTYSNLAKEEMLGVSSATLNTYGAVSEQTAQEMAEGALRYSQAQVSIAITGIAGPTGGTPEKPVGTVWFGWAGVGFATQTKLMSLTGNRTQIREQSIVIALENLLNLIT